MDDVMAYASVDDGFWDHPKVLLLLGLEHGRDGLALWTLALSWSHDYTRRHGFQQAGFVPFIQAERLLGNFDDAAAAAGALVKAGLWDEAEGGFQIHDFDAWQGVDRWRAMSEGGRRGAQIRHGRAAGHRAASRGATDTPVGGPEGGALARPVGSPLATEEQENNKQVGANAPTYSPGSSDLALVERPEVERLCSLLADRIEGNGSKRPAVTKGWRDACRLLLDRDGRTEKQVEACIEWCQRDEFWRSNILSMPTLRKQYDRLRLEAERKRSAGNGRVSKDDRVREMLARADELERGTT